MQNPRTYRKSLGFPELVCLGVGGTIGSGIFVVPGVAAQLAGPSSLIAWLVVSISACAVAFALGTLQARTPHGLPLVDLFTQILGKRVAVLLVTVYVIGSIFGVATIAAGLGQYLSYFGMTRIAMIEALIIAAMLALNLKGISFSGIAEVLLSVIKILGILAIIALLAPLVEVRSLVPQTMAPLPVLLQVVIVVYWPFTGFEISAIPVGEIKDSRSIAPALFAVMVVVCAIYLGLNLVLLGAVGAPELASSPAPVAEAMGLAFKGAGPWVAALAIITMLSALNAYIVGASRCLQDVLQMRNLRGATQLSTRGVPTAALLVTCLGAAALLAFSNRFNDLAAIAVVMTLIPYVALCWVAFSGGKSAIGKGISLFGAIVTTAILVLYFSL